MTRAEEKRQSKAALEAAARALFTARAYDAVGIRDIAKAADDRSTGSIFAHYPLGKTQLYEAAMGRPAPDVRLKAFLVGVETYGGPDAEDARLLLADIYGLQP